MTNRTSDSKPSRRSFLDLLLAASGVAWLGSLIYPIVRYLKPLPQAGPGGPTRLTGEELSKLEQEDFIITSVGGRRVLVLKDADQTVMAFDAKCTHEGCTVQYVPGESTIWCACHNARFDLTGRVLSGPPPRPLPKYIVDQPEPGAIIVIAEETKA